MNSRKQGDVGTGFAIAHFLSNGYTVSIPISDSQAYDLVVEKSGQFLKVQAKTCFKKRVQGNCSFYNVELRTVSNTRGKKLSIRKLTKDDCDLIFIVDGENKKYLIPFSNVEGMGQISLSSRQEFLVG